MLWQSVPADGRVLPSNCPSADNLQADGCSILPAAVGIAPFHLKEAARSSLAVLPCIVSMLMAAPAVPAGVQLLPFHSKEAALPDLGPAASWPQLMQAEEGRRDGKAAQRTGLLTFFEPHSWHQVGSA